MVEDLENSVRPSLELCGAPVPPTPLWEFPHLLLLSLFLLLKLIQHGLETGLQTQTWRPQLSVCSQQNGCCYNISNGTVTTTPLSPRFSDYFASMGKCWSVYGHITAIFNPASKGSWLLQISLLDLMVSQC